MPRPPEAPAIKVLEQEVDTYRTQMSLITEALNVKKVRAAGGCCWVGQRLLGAAGWGSDRWVLLPWPAAALHCMLRCCDCRPVTACSTTSAPRRLPACAQHPPLLLPAAAAPRLPL